MGIPNANRPPQKNLQNQRNLTHLRNPISNTWVLYPTKKQVSSMITSRIKSKDGKVIFKKYLKLYKC
jgi:hypothetical protein